MKNWTNIGITIENEDTDLANIYGITLFYKHLVTVVIGRLHTVTADRDNEVGLLRL